MDIHWAQQCITTAVKTSTYRPRLVNASWTHSSFSHNFQMPQLSSTFRFIMAANDISNALQNTHPEVPFSHIRDDITTALTTLAEIFKNKFQKFTFPNFQLHLPRPLNANYPPHHPIQSWLLTCPRSAKLDHKQQFTLKT
jgi:hypothetical protein